LQIGVQVDLDDTVRDCFTELLLGGTGAAVEDEKDGLVVFGAGLLFHVGLMFGEQFRVELNISWFLMLLLAFGFTNMME